MPIDGKTQEIPPISWLYFCCKLGDDNKIGVAGFHFLRGAAKRVVCDEQYKEEDENYLWFQCWQQSVSKFWRIISGVSGSRGHGWFMLQEGRAFPDWCWILYFFHEYLSKTAHNNHHNSPTTDQHQASFASRPLPPSPARHRLPLLSRQRHPPSRQASTNSCHHEVHHE